VARNTLFMGLAVASLLLAGCEVREAQPESNQAEPDNSTANLADPMAPGSYESVFTSLMLDECATIGTTPATGGRSLQCLGHDGVPLFVTEEDGRADLDAGLENGRWESLGGFNSLGSRVEWRLHGGRPVAVIFRYESDGRAVLGVETVGRASGKGSPSPAPGCEIARVDAGLPNAATLARQRADALAERFQCGVDKPETHGLTG
jgi:hypothetical protein